MSKTQSTKKTKKVKLTPPDPKQCQGERRVGAFAMGGRIGELIRCTNKPTVIATERKAGADGLKGSMSLCDSCQAKMEKQLGADFATYKVIV